MSAFAKTLRKRIFGTREETEETPSPLDESNVITSVKVDSRRKSRDRMNSGAVKEQSFIRQGPSTAEGMTNPPDVEGKTKTSRESASVPEAQKDEREAVEYIPKEKVAGSREIAVETPLNSVHAQVNSESNEMVSMEGDLGGEAYLYSERSDGVGTNLRSAEVAEAFVISGLTQADLMKDITSTSSGRDSARESTREMVNSSYARRTSVKDQGKIQAKLHSAKRVSVKEKINNMSPEEAEHEI